VRKIPCHQSTAFLTALLFSGYLGLSLGAQEPAVAADVVLLGGRIWTGEPYLPPGQKAVPSQVCSAAAILNGRFIAVGSDAEIRPLVGPKTEVIELRGRMAMPGFNDSHVHFIRGANQITQVNLKEARTKAEFTALIAAKAKTLKPGQWILGGRWDPTRALIDAVTRDNPVYVSRYDGHEGLANSLALKLAGITRETHDPAGGVIMRDAAGEPTGVLKDTAQLLMNPAITPPSWAEFELVMRAGLAEAAKDGITTLQDMNFGLLTPDGTIRDQLVLLHRAEAEGWLTARFYEILLADPGLQLLKQLGLARNFGSDLLQLGAIKEFADGSIGSRTGWFFDDYTDQPGYKGVPRSAMEPPEKMLKLVREADEAGIQLSIHAVGDHAIAELLDIYQQAGGTDPASHRFRIEHLQHIRKEDLARLARLGVIASMQPYHAIDDGRFVWFRIGYQRSLLSYAWRSVLDAGAPLAFGTDWPVAPLNPLLGVWAAVTRDVTVDGKTSAWIPEQRITLEETLRAYTQGSAYAQFQEKEKGTISPGKLADIIVLSDDLFAIPAERIKAVTVLRTLVGGRTVYAAP